MELSLSQIEIPRTKDRGIILLIFQLLILWCGSWRKQ
jgi:hypothetical protein